VLCLTGRDTTANKVLRSIQRIDSNWTVHGSNPGKGKIFLDFILDYIQARYFFSKTSRPAPGPILPPIKSVPRFFSRTSSCPPTGDVKSNWAVPPPSLCHGIQPFYDKRLRPLLSVGSRAPKVRLTITGARNSQITV